MSVPGTHVGRVYEIEVPTSDGVDRVITRWPRSILDPLLGAGDAWSLIDAANRAWDGEPGDWVALFGSGHDS
mgnify:FL=1